MHHCGLRKIPYWASFCQLSTWIKRPRTINFCGAIWFIFETLVFAVLTIAHRFSPSRVFFVYRLLEALFNVAIILEGNTLTSIVSLRFATGFFLTGIYPLGMKIAADYFIIGDNWCFTTAHPNSKWAAQKAKRTNQVISILRSIQESKISFRSFGYFGHMWELYEFWAFVPIILTAFSIK